MSTLKEICAAIDSAAPRTDVIRMLCDWLDSDAGLEAKIAERARDEYGWSGPVAVIKGNSQPCAYQLPGLLRVMTVGRRHYP